MTPNQFNEFKTALIAAVDAHIAGGGKLVVGHFRDGEGGYCPVECVVPGNGDGIPVAERLAVKFPFIDGPDIWELIFSFDGHDMVVETDMTRLGQELRQLYLNKE